MDSDVQMTVSSYPRQTTAPVPPEGRDVTTVMAEPKLLLSLVEASYLTGLSRRELDRQIVAGRLRSVKVGRRRFVARRDLEEFIEEATETRAA
jgi:excisionase family DNA binding protein